MTIANQTAARSNHWTDQETALLVEWTNAGRTALAIAQELGRSHEAVKTKRRWIVRSYKAAPKPTTPPPPVNTRIQQLVATIEREAAAAKPRQAYLYQLRTGLLRLVRDARQ
jgi:hypothetical protein